MARLACVKVHSTSLNPQVIFSAVRRAMVLTHWPRYITGPNVILKVNVVWDKLYPSCTTSPMVIEGIIKVLRSSPKKFTITIVDTDTAAIVNADLSFKIQGITDLAKKYDVKIINLSHTEFTKVHVPHASIIKNLRISKLLLSADTIITVPVLKTHSYSQMTGSLKNQWGCIHDLRHNFHTVLSQAIADVNLYFKPQVKFAVVDALFGMEGYGPKAGIPRKIGYILASSDLVATDTTMANIMGLEPHNIKHIVLSFQAGIGNMSPHIVGSPLPHFNFKPASGSNIVMNWEMKIRHQGPLVEKIFFAEKSPFLFLLRWSAKFYYDFWYQFIGVKYVQRMMATNYGRIWQTRYLNATVHQSI